MVFEGVLVEVLNHFLRPYVKNLDPSQLNVAIWSGDVLLENLELKESALDDLHIPVRVFRGHLEKLKLKIPWKNLYSAPTIAEIDGLYVVAGPATAFKYDAEKSEKEKRERKQKQLKKIEDARKKATELKDDKASQDPGFVQKLIANMIRNIQITIKNIHIRYEDAVTNTLHPFSFGITLDSLFVQSTDCEYVVGGAAVDSDPAAMLIYKLLQLNCLSVYWQSDDNLLGISPPDNWMELLKGDIARPNSDTQMDYLVHPITLEARLQLTTIPGRDMEIPQALVQVTLQEVSLALSRNQFKDIMLLVESFDRMTINLKFLKYRPEVGVREGPREWWGYAISAVTEEEVKRKLEMWSWKHIQQHRQWCRQYTKSYTRRLLAKSITSKLQEELDFLEMKLDVFNITVCRQLAESKAAQTRRAQEEAVREAGGGEGGGGWWGWASGWMSGGSGGGASEEEETLIVHMPSEEELQEEKERMYEAIGYSENAELANYPKEYVAHRVVVQLEEVSVRLWNETGTVARVHTSSVTVRVQNRPSSKNITVQTTVGRLMARGLSCGSSGVGGDEPIILFSKHGEEASLLDLCVDVNPVDGTVSQRLRMHLLPIQITYHADTVDAIISMFILSKDVQLQRLSAAAASTIEELKTQGRAGLEHAISQRRLLDLDVVINSPCIVVPQNGTTSESSCVLVADLGCLEIKSDLKSYVPDVRGATDEELDEAFYDHFTLSLTRLQVLLAGPKQDWTAAWSSSSSPLHLLEPTSLELELKKSLLPNDTRLPNMKVKGELPSLTLSVSDNKLKQLLQLVQSIPLPPPSLAKKRMESSSTYSIPDQPAHMNTDSIVGTISETLLVGEMEEESSEEFMTASECESDDEGVLHHRSSRDSKSVAATSTKLSLQFSINKIGILFSEHHESSGHDTPRLHLMVTSVTSDLLMRSWDMQLMASVGNLLIADHYITGSDGEPGTFLSTQLTEHQKFLTFSYSKYDPLAPHYVTEFKSTRQSVSVCVSLLQLNIHSESLLNLIEIGRSIAAVMKTADTVLVPEEKPEDSSPSSSSSSSSLLAEGESRGSVRGEKELQLRASLMGVEVAMCGGDVGQVMSASVTGLETQVDVFQDQMQVKASMTDVVLVDNEPSAQHKQIIHKMDEAKEIISLKVTVYKHSISCDPRDLSTCDLDIAAAVERVRVMVVFSFLGRVQRFAGQFLHRLHLDQSTIDSAREAASNTASRTAEALKEQSSSRVKLDIIIRAPLIIVPYAPSISPPLSPPSPLSPLTPPPQRAFVANLGELTVKNVFKLASEVAAEPALRGGKEMDPSLFLSPLGLPAVVDCMNVTISSVQLGRVLDMEKVGIGKSASGDIHAKSYDVSADSHALMWPLEFKGQITRRLCDWCTSLPAISIACNMGRIQLQFSPLDYQDMMCMLQDMKKMKPDHVEEESSSELSSVDISSVGELKEEKSVTDKKEEEEREGEPSSGVSVHVEAVVGSLELILYSHIGGVAEVKVKGVATTVDMHGYGMDVQAKISGVEVLDCTPDAIYRKIVSVEEDKSAVETQVTYYFDATKGTGRYDASKSDLAVQLRVNRIRIVALYLFVSRILNYIQQLHVQVSNPESTSQEDLDDSLSVVKEESSSSLPMRMKLDISIRAPEITVPLSSLSHDIVVLDLGQLMLVNEFLVLDVGFSDDKDKALYEQYSIKLTELQIFRSVWDRNGNRPADCQRGLLEPVTLDIEMQRNLSAQWYHGIPTIAIDAKLEPLKVVASADDIESLCLVLNGNLKEHYSSAEGALESSNLSTETVNEQITKHSRVHKECSKVGEETDGVQQSFTEFLVSARLKSIGLTLFFKDHALSCEDVATWTREGKREFAALVLEDFRADFKKESSGTVSAKLSLENCVLDDLRASLDEEEGEEEEEEEEDEGSTRESSVDAIRKPEKHSREIRIRRMIQKREFEASLAPPLISLDYNLSHDNDTRLGLAVDGIQVLANLKFIESVVSFLRDSTRPLTEGTTTDGAEGEEGGEEPRRAPLLHHQVSMVSESQTTVGGRESKVSISVEVVRPLIALLEDARQMNTAALVCQLEVHGDLSRRLPSNQTSIHGSLSGLTLSTARYPHLDQNIFKPVLGPLSDDILAYMDQWDGSTKVNITVPSLELVLSPATVRLVLNSVRSLSLGHVEEAEVGETAPANLWSSRPITRGPLRKKWYLRDTRDSEHITPTTSHTSTQPSLVSSGSSHLWSESLEMQVSRITVLIEQEVTTPTLQTFPVISLAMGKYSTVALFLRLQDWSSKLRASTELFLEASYYNIRTDSWEPILEPIVDPQNESQYVSWGMKAKVVRSLPDHTHSHAKEEGEEEEEEEEETAGLSVDVCADSALQLTVTKTSLSIFTELVQAYTEKKSMVFEAVDTPETYDAAFTIVNRLGKKYPVTVKPSNTLKVHGAYSPVLRQDDSPLPLHPVEGMVRMKPGELLARDSHLSRIHIVQLQIQGFAPLNVALGMYERVYYPLSVVRATEAEDKERGPGVVVDIDRTAGTPVVTLRSPLQVYNHLDQLVTVHYSLSASPPLSGTPSTATVPAGSTVPLPLNTTGLGYLFFQLPRTGLSQPALSWEMESDLDIACSLRRAGREGDQQSFSFIHTELEEEKYSRTPSFSLTERAHHTIHLHHPLVVHNLLPYSIALAEEGHSMILIGSGCQANINYTRLSRTQKFLLEVEKKNKRWSGSFMMGSKSDEETEITVSAQDSSTVDLVVKKEEKSTWEMSVFSYNWIVNKTGLTLQYRAPDGFFSFGQRSSDVYTHRPESAISLYPHKEACVRVVKGERYSEWSAKFSLEALGSEGIFSCNFKDSSEELQIGTKVELSRFGTTRTLTLSPFYMINNTTRDSVSFRECSQNSRRIYTVRPGELLPFWPVAGGERLEVSVGDEAMTHHSAPFRFTETRSLFVRTAYEQEQPRTTPSSRLPQVVALAVEIQVTGSANIVTFSPFYPGCVPLQLVNHTEHSITFNQINGPHSYCLEASRSLMYTWDLPLGEKQLVMNTRKQNKIVPQEDGSGSFYLPTESTGSAAGSTAVEGGKDEADGPLEDITTEQDPLEEGEEEDLEKEAIEEMETRDDRERGGEGAATEPPQGQVGTDEVDFSLKGTIRKLRKNVTTFSSRKKQPKKRGRKVYWISFMDGLQRVVLFTASVDLKKMVDRGREREQPHTELFLSLIGIGLSLVDDIRGQEVAYIGIPQSQKEWQIRVKRLWKPVSNDISEKLEQLYDSSQRSKGRKILPDTDYEVDFNRMYLYETSKGTKNKLRRSHFEGVYTRISLSEHLTSIILRISHVQIDNQLPLTLHPIIIYPYPPPPSVANSCAPKPFIEGTVVIHKTEQSNINQIQYLQVLIQEIGVNLDMSFLMALLNLFSQLPSSDTEAQVVRKEIEYAKLPLKESKVVAVSAAVSRNYFKFLHLSPLIIHLSFSLEMSDRDGREAKKATERNVILSMMLNLLLSFAAIIGKTKDAELQLRYFEVEDESLTQQALMDRIIKHYTQEGVIQMYSVVLGLEVLGNPVGFVRGLKAGTVGLFYHPIQGAVLGPEEFLEGMKLGGKQFVGGTVGGISGVLGKVTGVLGDTAANLTLDDEFVSQRKRTKESVGQSLEGVARGVFQGVTGVVSQPLRGAKKEGIWGLVKGTGKGVLGLVLRPTGGLIDLTSATFNAVQRKTRVGDYDVTQLRPPRFIGQPKFVSPYSPHKAEGYALFLAVDNGRLREEGDVYFDHIEMTENPLKVLLVTNNRFVVIKKVALFDRFEEDWKVMLRDMYNKTMADRNKVVVPVLEEHGWFLSSKKKKLEKGVKHLEVSTAALAMAAVKIVNQAYQEYSTTQTKKHH